MLNNILEARAAAGQTDVKPVKLTTSKFPFKQMEVIGQYLDRISKLGVLSQESFQTVDLYEGKNMLQVIDSIFALSRHGMTLPPRPTFDPSAPIWLPFARTETGYKE